MNKPSSICHPFQSCQWWEISLQLHSSNTIGFVLLRLVLSSNGMYFSFFHLVKGARLIMSASNGQMIVLLCSKLFNSV